MGGGKKGLKTKAFTLAEVLITLVVIGVVAAITVPIINNTIQDKQFSAKAKKVYSVVDNALRRAQAEEGSIGDNSALFNPEQTSKETMRKFSKYLNIMQTCPAYDTSDICQELSFPYRFSANEDYSWNTRERILLPDGVLLGVEQRPCEAWRKLDAEGNKTEDSFYESACGIIFVDLNGATPPNTYGRDFFLIRVERTHTEPYGVVWGNYNLKDYLTNLR